jgi:predicted DNA-binding transcriptional regulator AlpA
MLWFDTTFSLKNRAVKWHILRKEGRREPSNNLATGRDQMNFRGSTERLVISPDEYCEMTGESRATIDRKHKRGEGPPRIRLSTRRVGYLVSDVLEYLRACKIVAD